MNVRFWSSPKLVAKAPILATALLEYANLGQIHRMWTQQTAAGQSLGSWAAVCAALVLYWNFYRVVTPDQVWARRMSVVGISLNVLVCLTVVYFRMTGRG